MNRLNTRNIEAYNLPFPTFSHPKELGQYCIDGNRKYHADARNLRYLDRNVQISYNKTLDLNKGYDTDLHKNQCDVFHGIGNLLHWVRDNRCQESLISEANFICYRGLLTKVACCPYERDGFIIYATRYDNKIFMCLDKTEQDQERNQNMSDRELRMSAWGYKFEQYMTTDKLGSEPNTTATLNEEEEYCSVAFTALNDHKILMGAEVDCIDPGQKGATGVQRYIELKTNKMMKTNPAQMRGFLRYKLIKWWLQCFLFGVPTVLCGFRDDNGFVSELQYYEVKDMPKLAKNIWNPAVCINFLDTFLAFVKRNLKDVSDRTILKFERRPQDDVVCTRVEDSLRRGEIESMLLENY